MIVVSNSSPLISLAKIDSFDLTRQVYGTLSISAEVYTEEVVVSGAGFPGAVETSSSAWIQVRQISNAGTLAAAQARSGLGELSTIVLAKEIQADLVILRRPWRAPAGAEGGAPCAGHDCHSGSGLPEGLRLKPQSGVRGSTGARRVPRSRPSEPQSSVIQAGVDLKTASIVRTISCASPPLSVNGGSSRRTVSWVQLISRPRSRARSTKSWPGRSS